MDYIPLTDVEKSKLKPHHVSGDYDAWSTAVSLIGTSVIKISGSPFKSTSKVNTVSGVTRNPYTNLWGVTFLEDDSIVDVKQVKKAKVPE